MKEGAAAADTAPAAAPVFVTALAAGFTACVEVSPRVDAGFTAAAAVAAAAVLAAAGLFAAAAAWTAAEVAAAAAVLVDPAELLSSRRLLPPVLLLLSAAAHPVAAPSDTDRAAVTARLEGDRHMQHQLWL